MPKKLRAYKHTYVCSEFHTTLLRKVSPIKEVPQNNFTLVCILLQCQYGKETRNFGYACKFMQQEAADLTECVRHGLCSA